MKNALTILCSLLILSYPSHSHAWNIWPFGDDGIEFDIEINGLDGVPANATRLEELAREAIDAENPPQDIAALNAVGGLMAERIRKAMHARAFYDAEVPYDVEPPKEKNGKPLVIFEVMAGQRYAISGNQLEYQDDAAMLEQLKALTFAPGATAMTQGILNVAENMQTILREQRCYLSIDVTPRLILDKAQGTVQVRYEVAHGAQANYGQTMFTGGSEVSERVLKRYLKWKQGECFNPDKISATQTAMLQSQLFASADIQVAEVPDAQGQAPVTVKLTDRPHRTVAAGGGFASDEGVGVKLGWEHRNVLGRAHRFTSNATISQLEYGVDGQYSIPYFYHAKQKLNISGNIGQENTDSFESTGASVLVALDRKLTKELLIGIGGGARFSRIKEEGDQTENFGLLYVPIYAEWETRDDVLDPTKGIYARASMAPYQDVTGQGVNFLKTDIIGHTYLTANYWLYKPTLALRGAYGQINGASTRSVPADLRFFAGGGGSVRGYNYRAIGPRDNGEAEGGTAWTELSAEGRLRFTEEFGGVIFVDAGNVYDQSLPDPGQKLFLSAGVGARYYSPIGPLRLDVGIPLDEVEDDAAFGVYVSIGQAF